MLFCLCVTLDRDAPARRPHSAHGDRSSSRFFFFFSPEFTPRLDKTKAATPVMEPLFATAFGKKKKIIIMLLPTAITAARPGPPDW